MFPANKGIFHKVAESICSKLRYNNKISNNSFFPGSRCIPKRLQHTNVNSDNKLLFRRGDLDGKANTNEVSNVNCFSILGTDNNGTRFSLEKNYFLSNHRFDMQSYGSRIVGSCNGIICLQDHIELGNVVLWNPVTDELKSLPPSSIDFSAKAPYKFVGSSGFGYDARSDDYKVVRFVENGFFSNYRTTHHFELYSLKTDSWMPIVNPVSIRYPTRYPLHIYSISLNGSCYWEAGNCILSFDFADEVFSYLPLPPISDLETHEDFVRCLVGIDGSTLGLIVYPFNVQTTMFDLWVWESKELYWTTNLDNFELENIRKPLGLWGGDKCFLVGDNDELLLFDLKIRELKPLGIKDHHPWAMNLVSFVESTVSIK